MSFSFCQSELSYYDGQCSVFSEREKLAVCWRFDRNYLICWCGKRRMQTSHSFVLVSWWCCANLVPRSALSIHKCENEAILVWVVNDELVGRPMFAHCSRQTWNRCWMRVRKSVRDKVYNTITVRTFLWQNKKRALFHSRRDCRLIYSWVLAASAAVSANAFLVWMNYGTMLASRSRHLVSQQNWMR